MNARSLALPLVLLVALSVTIVLRARREEAPTVTPPEAPVVAEPVEEAPPEPAEEEREEESAREVAGAPEEAAEEPEPRLARPTGTITYVDRIGSVEMTGSVVLTTADGDSLAPPTGTVTVFVRSDEGSSESTLAVQEGQFRARFPRRAQVRAKEFLFDERVAVPMTTNSLAVIENGHLELGARLLRDVRLEVRLSVGAPASDIVVARLRPPPPASLFSGHLGLGGRRSPTRVAVATSPFGEVVVPPHPPQRGRTRYAVRAHGTRWHEIELDHQYTDYVVELDPGGELAIDLVGRSPRKGQTLRLLGPDGFEERHPIPETDGTLRFPHLPVGPYTVVAESDPPDVFELGLLRTDVRPGESTHLEMYLADDPTPERTAPLHMRVEVPAEWDSDEPWVRFLSLPSLNATGGGEVIESQQLTPVDGSDGEAYELEQDLPLGTYLASFVMLGYVEQFSHTAEATQHRIRVPSPQVIEVRFRTWNDEPHPATRLTWSVKRPTGGWREFANRRVERAPDTDAFVFPAIPGEIHLRLADEAFETRLDVSRGERFVIRVGG